VRQSLLSIIVASSLQLIYHCCFIIAAHFSRVPFPPPPFYPQLLNLTMSNIGLEGTEALAKAVESCGLRVIADTPGLSQSALEPAAF
jgi:hypothetical protein